MRRLGGVLVLAWFSLFARTKPFQQVLLSVPEDARLKRNPMESDPAATGAGEKLFEQHCAQCHGKGAIGGRRAPPLTGFEMQQATPGEVFWIISNGIVRHGMPSWTRLPEPQRWQIVTFLRSNAAAGLFAAVPSEAREKRSPFAGDGEAPAAGQMLFAQNCAPCHGTSARGSGRAPSLVGNWIQRATPGELFWVISNGAPLQGMPAWSKLSEAQRWRIVAFLKSANAAQR